jgi:hypothetical protein
MSDRRLVITMNVHGVDHETFGSNEETRRTEVRETIDLLGNRSKKSLKCLLEESFKNFEPITQQL